MTADRAFPRRHAKFTRLDDELYAYILRHCNPPPTSLELELIAETAALGAAARMQIPPDEAALLRWLVSIIKPTRAIEIGTFTGYSALAIAEAMPDDGRLLTCDVNKGWADIAQRFWKRAGVAHKIDLKLAPAIETLRALAPSEQFGFAFVDADKESYQLYYDELLPRLPPGAVLVVDNALWGGRVTDRAANDVETSAIRAFNEHVANDRRVEALIVPVGDGVMLIRRTHACT